MRELRAIPVRGMGEVRAGEALADSILAALQHERLRLVKGDILVVTHKIVSKAEGRLVALDSAKPTVGMRRWGRKYKRDPRVLALALRESRRIVRKKRGVLITETRHGTRGFVCAQSGVDVSNVDGGASAALLPRAPDESAARLHRQILSRTGTYVPVIISDSFGRPWREGLTEVAIGCAGMAVFRDVRGQRDPYGYQLQVTREAVADELAAMAGLACGKLSRIPACVIRGFDYQRARGRGAHLLRDRKHDLFR
jgi:coenzyme F420-0:L-glutamate ligase / coenzyme F420-1:gamma-L-glutamate ligase